MYKVFCRARKNQKWVEYSADFSTFEEAEKCKEMAEKILACDIHGNLIVYKIFSV